MRFHGILLALGLVAVSGCDPVTEPPGETPDLRWTGPNAIHAFARGQGNYLLAETFDIRLEFRGARRWNGEVAGSFHQSLLFDDQLVSFDGEFTCITVDADNHRAWIGGVVTRNDSEHPAFQEEINQPGRDVWFRVLDTGFGSAEPDRSTFLGFEGGGGIITSAEYCEAQIWPDDNARTHPVTGGFIEVRP